MQWMYVNECLVRTQESFNMMVNHYMTLNKEIVIRPVPKDENGGYIVPILDPMEQ